MSSQLEGQAPFEGTVLGFLYRQFARPKPLPAGVRLTGQVAIVTGANTGLGFEASRQLLGLGLAHLIVAVRSQARGDAAAGRLREEHPGATVSVWLVDMASYDSVRAFSDRCRALPRIDVLILNAALMASSFATDPATGHEMSMQVNYLSTALLTILLLPVLKSKKAPGATRPPVLTIVGSDLAYFGEVETKGPLLPQFQNANAFSSMSWYAKSKLLLILFLAKVAGLVDPDDVLINMANPGMARGTEIFRHSSSAFMMVMGTLQVFLARSLEVGATTYIHSAVTQGKESHGSFLSDWTTKPYPKIWYTEEGREVTERLWEETMEELNFAGASKIVEQMKTGR